MLLLRKLLSTTTRLDNGAIPASEVQRGPAGQGSPSVAQVAERDRLWADVAAHETAGRYSEALAVIAQATATSSSDPELLFARASVLFAWGRFREARDVSLRAEAMGVRHATLYLMLGWSCLATRDPAIAETWMRKATIAEQADWKTHFGLAAALRAQKRFDEAIVAF